jgi:hypothetical protein
MAEFKISRFRYTWKGAWTTATAYIKDDVVKFGGSSWVCVRGHTSSAFATNQTYVPPESSEIAPAWIKMTDGYEWRDEWAGPGTLYNPGDVVSNGGEVYLCLTSHTSASTFVANASNWAVYTSGISWVNDWTTTTRYEIGDLAKYNGTVYRCTVEHLSGSILENLAGDSALQYWETYNSGVEYVGNWRLINNDASSPTFNQASVYRVNDLAKYGGSIWRCKQTHTVGDDSTLNFKNEEYWTLEFPGQQRGTDWLPNTEYQPGDFVTHGGIIYVSLTENYNRSPGAVIYQLADQLDPADWAIVSKGLHLVGPWTPTTITVASMAGRRLQVGMTISVVRGTGEFETNTKIVEVFNDTTFTVDKPPLIELDDAVVEGVLNITITQATGAVSTSTLYKTGDVVRRGGYTYVALLDTTTDGSTLDYLDSSNWEIIVPSVNWKNTWTPDELYNLGDIVSFSGSVYVCTDTHISIVDNHPGDNGNAFDVWNMILMGSENIGLRSVGDLLTYGLSRDLAGDGSSFGAADVPIGVEDKLLVVTGSDTPDYATWGNTSYLVNVAPNGVDDDFDSERGFNYFKPWKTIRYACERIEALGLNVGNTVKVRVWPGVYEEILPIIVPANVAIQGDEVRSITVKPNAPITELGNDSTYTIAVLNRIGSLIEDILDGTLVTKSIGNLAYQVIPNPTLSENGAVIATNLSTREIGGEIIGLIDDIKAYINFYINSTGTDPVLVSRNDNITELTRAGNFVVGEEYQILTLGTTVFTAFGATANTVGTIFTATTAGTGTGTAVLTNAIDYANALIILESNKEFLASEAVAYMQQFFPNYAFSGELCKRDVRRYIDAWKYDIIYTGNYKSLLAARYYKNAVLGSAGEDMFYVRDATGVRNMTLSGLTGTLNPLGVFDYYQRPTGGAYVSLDPGWGPDDDRVWITTRSCYVQNCTTFGFAAIGQKIDGSLHNGGNRSIVSNDFTQVISDGIGAWVLNNGRAELVSVFTYYSQVGYLAESGGIIRATNGNNSYGSFGAVAIGVDDTEVPFTGRINNRNNDAQIAAAFAGEVNDEILILEFDHAGQNFTSASYTFTGAGSSASVVQDEFRDDAVFEVRLTNAADSSGIIGGRGYTSFENNAQTGDLTTIQLSTQDANEESDYLGKRIIIVSGTGTGQYGYITAYNTGTKTISVAKESTGAAGWDHVISGTPIVNPLLPDTRYRIEPRLTFSAPAYTAESVSAVDSATWSSIVYGETTEVYANVIGDAGTGTVETQDGLIAITARWTVSKIGRTYSLVLTNYGAGYAVGDDIIIEGTQVGGSSPENDITIIVTEVSEDSTNSIISYTYEGIGTSGKFIATPTAGTAFRYSNNGSTWLDGSFPVAGNWNVLASGANKFIAIKSGSTSAMSSDDGVAWTSRTIGTVSRTWNAAVYGTNRFVAVSSTANVAAYSTNGTTWTETSMSAGDSTFNAWVDVCYGKNKFVAVANTSNAISYSTDGITWSAGTMDSISDSSQKDWVSIAYGNNRYVAISSQGDVAYSFDLQEWYDASMPVRSSTAGWTKLRYAQGVFFAVRTNASNTWATSPDGILWTSRTPATAQDWSNLAFGNPDVTLEDSTLGNSKPMWVVIGSNLSSTFNKVVTGATARVRAIVQAGEITSIRIWEPGSAYTEQPTLTIVDPNEFIETFTENRIGDGVLANPSWINRGIGYRTSTTAITVTGDGFADIIPVGKFITLSDLEEVPPLGGQLIISGNTTIYTIVTVRELDSIHGTTAFLQISPTLTELDDVQHDTLVSIRRQFSQCRITGHDFLDIGTGNFIETNYPELYATGLVDAQPFNEVVEEDGGRVFYTSTDQSGNFRTGELFAVEQATGIVTISADFFDLAGLSELRLGGVRLGGTGVVIREFSTDPFFYEDSNNVVPTQRAIKTYLANRLSIGGADFVTGAVTAGQIKVGPNGFTNILGLKIRVPVAMNFAGPKAGVTGYMLAQAMFYRSFTQD